MVNLGAFAGLPLVLNLTTTILDCQYFALGMGEIYKYNARWNSEAHPLQIELECIKWGGQWQSGNTICGKGMFYHLMEARKWIWPDRYRHDWTDLMYQEFVQNDITMLMGAASTQKTSHASEYVLLKYWASPNDTLVIVSTIDVDKLDTGVFGEIKMLWSAGRERFDWLPGNLIDHRHCIATHCLADGEVRDLRCGILGRPCYQGSQWIGLGKLLGTKQRNIIFLADEVPWMAPTFIESWANLFSNGKVQIIGSGNPKGDPDDQLGIAAEPEDGWASIGEPKVTTTWNTKFLNGRCVNLVGIDSPNFRAAAKGLPETYPGLIGPRFARRIAHDWGLDSPKYYEQVYGIMKIGMATDRVLTRQICRDHHAYDLAVWLDDKHTKIHGLDPSYGGEDACISTILEWGKDTNGEDILSLVLQKEHRFNIRESESVEDQIANQVWDMLNEQGIPPTNSFYDPYGKGTLGFAFARKFGANSPIPIDSGGKPTDRPVRQDLFVVDKDGARRQKRCSEHYVKFVTEAWFSVAYVVQAGQMRQLTEEIVREMSARKYSPAFGDRIEIESKDDLKERTGKSPNRGDSIAIAVEGARQRGFKIGKLGNHAVEDPQATFAWLKEKVKNHNTLIQSKQLTHA